MLLVGLFLVGTAASEVGESLVLAGLVATMYGVHGFGRLGPEEARP